MVCIRAYNYVDIFLCNANIYIFYFRNFFAHQKLTSCFLAYNGPFLGCDWI